MVTVISFNKTSTDIGNMSRLPPRISLAILATGSIVVRGFQELLGYDGRQLIWSAGGYWNGRGKKAKFIVRNFGNNEYQWDGETLRTTSCVLNA